VIRVGDIATSGSVEYYMPDSTVEVERVKVHATALKTLDLNGPKFQEDFYFRYKQKVHIPLSATTKMAKNGYVWNARVDAGLRVTSPQVPPPNGSGVIPVVGTSIWESLTPTQQAQFVDVYGDNNYYWTPPAEVPLNSVVLQTTLNGLVYYANSPPPMLTLKDLNGFTEVNP
jgi:hypothetical protein